MAVAASEAAGTVRGVFAETSRLDPLFLHGVGREGLFTAALDCIYPGMHLELTDEQTEALIRELSLIIDGDRYPLSPRIVVLKEILGQLRPEPARPAPLPP